MDVINFIVGVLLIILGVALYLYESQKVKKEKKNDYMLKSFNIQIFFGIIVLIIVGIVLVFRELKTLF